MGGAFSRRDAAPPPGDGMGADPRPPLVYSSLQFLDLVLMRSQAVVSGSGLDSRLASHIRYASMGLQVPAEVSLSKWDRVGLVQLPSFLEPWQFDADNILVTEASYSGIQSRTLRQVMDTSLEVVVRRLVLGKQAVAREAQQKQRETEAEDSAQQQPQAASAAAPALDLDDSFDLHDSDERLAFLQRYYQFTGPVINRPFGQCMDKLEAMFRAIMQRLRRFELGDEEKERMDAVLEAYMVPFAGQDGSENRGIPFDSLLPLFRELSEDAGLSNTFSDAEIYELVGSFTLGDDRISLSNSGFISKSEFLTQWRESLARTLPVRRLPREIISGAFVSQALQAIGALPASGDAYYLPMDFAMTGPPPEGWDRHAPERERARALRGAASSAASSSLALRLAVDSGLPSDGAAILRIHAHGVAKVGVEQQVLQPPPTFHEEEPQSSS